MTTHREWQQTVTGMLEVFGCVVDHTYPLMTRDGSFRTGSTLKGKPDLMAFHPRRWLLFIEIKVPPDVVKPEQLACLSLAAEVPCARAWVVTPDDPPWSDLQSWVRRPKEAPAIYGFEPVENPRRALELALRARRAANAEAKLRRQLRRGSRGPKPGTLPGLSEA